MSSPLITDAGAPEAAPRKASPLAVSVSIGLLAAIAGGLLLALLYGLFSAGPDTPVSDLHIDGSELGVRLGRAESVGDAIQVTGLESRGRRHALLTTRVRLDAADFSHLRYVIDDHHPSVEIFFVWLRADSAGSVYYGPLGRRGDGTGFIDLSDMAGWEGEIIGVGINVVGKSEDYLPTIRSLTLSPPSAMGQLGTAWSGWTRMNSWVPSSINHLRVPEDLRSMALAPAMAAWAGISLIIAAALQLFSNRFSPGPAGFVTAVLLPWIAFDLLWQLRLNDQLTQTRADFGGKTHHERRLSEPDAGLYAYGNYLKEDVLPEPGPRVFLLHDSVGMSKIKIWLHFHLLPHNVFSQDLDLNPQFYLREGDWVVIPGGALSALRIDGGAYHLMTSGASRVPLQLVDDQYNGRVFKVTGSRR
jgi:hypothetical protein